MPRKKKTELEATTPEVVEETPVKEKKTTRRTKKAKAEEEVKVVSKATIHDYDLILEPVITEKSMSASSELSQFTFIVKKGSNKTEIRRAIERIYNVHVTGISTINVSKKAKSHGSRYKGYVPGYKKAIVTLKEGETINLFAE